MRMRERTATELWVYHGFLAATEAQLPVARIGQGAFADHRQPLDRLWTDMLNAGLRNLFLDHHNPLEVDYALAGYLQFVMNRDGLRIDADYWGDRRSAWQF